MVTKYTYNDYEEAYYKQQWYKCKEIGIELLSKLEDDNAKVLLKKLKKMEYSWDLSQEEKIKIDKILFDVKVWLMINQNWF